ncbi:hypothetical protein ACI797_12240 [Geodermatophilus sp. SYSU D00691]
MTTEPSRRRSRADRLLGAAAEPSAPKPAREESVTPRSVRWAALVVALEAVFLVVVATYLGLRTLTGEADSDSGAWGLVVFALLGAVLLAACARGLWRLSAWARGPVVAVQLLLGAIGLTAAFEYQQQQVGIPMLVPVAVTLYLLSTPESRLAFFQRRGD